MNNEMKSKFIPGIVFSTLIIPVAFSAQTPPAESTIIKEKTKTTASVTIQTPGQGKKAVNNEPPENEQFVPDFQDEIFLQNNPKSVP